MKDCKCFRVHGPWEKEIHIIPEKGEYQKILAKWQIPNTKMKTFDLSVFMRILTKLITVPFTCLTRYRACGFKCWRGRNTQGFRSNYNIYVFDALVKSPHRLDWVFWVIIEFKKDLANVFFFWWQCHRCSCRMLMQQCNSKGILFIKKHIFFFLFWVFLDFQLLLILDNVINLTNFSILVITFCFPKGSI